jgi:ABC-type histidine transport system ATPase subunit
MKSATASSLLTAQGVTKRFGTHIAVNDVSLKADRGEAIAIIGQSGSGKSTFLRCLNFLEQADSGHLAVGEEHFDFVAFRNPTRSQRRQLERLRSRVGMVFQSFNLWPHRTAVENVMEGPVQVRGAPVAEARARALDLLAKVGLSERAGYYPSQLSGGQQQRVAIARALAMDPEILLFDEPTSALDPELVGEVLGTIRKLAAEGRTMLIVTHEIAFARDVASRVVFMANGSVCESGEPARILARPETPQLRTFLARFNQRDVSAEYGRGAQT